MRLVLDESNLLAEAAVLVREEISVVVLDGDILFAAALFIGSADFAAALRGGRETDFTGLFDDDELLVEGSK